MQRLLAAVWAALVATLAPLPALDTEQALSDAAGAVAYASLASAAPLPAAPLPLAVPLPLSLVPAAPAKAALPAISQVVAPSGNHTAAHKIEATPPSGRNYYRRGRVRFRN